VKFTTLYRGSAEGSSTTSHLDKPILKVEVIMKTLCTEVDFSHSVMEGLGKICWWALPIFALLSETVEEICFSDANDLKLIVTWGLDAARSYCATVTLRTLVEIISRFTVLWEEIIIDSGVEESSLWDRKAATGEQHEDFYWVSLVVACSQYGDILTTR